MRISFEEMVYWMEDDWKIPAAETELQQANKRSCPEIEAGCSEHRRTDRCPICLSKGQKHIHPFAQAME